MTGNYYEDYCEEPERSSVPISEYDELLQEKIQLEEENGDYYDYLNDICWAYQQGDKDILEETIKEIKEKMGWK